MISRKEKQTARLKAIEVLKEFKDREKKENIRPVFLKKKKDQSK